MPASASADAVAPRRFASAYSRCMIVSSMFSAVSMMSNLMAYLPMRQSQICTRLHRLPGETPTFQQRRRDVDGDAGLVQV